MLNTTSWVVWMIESGELSPNTLLEGETNTNYI